MANEYATGINDASLTSVAYQDRYISNNLCQGPALSTYANYGHFIYDVGKSNLSLISEHLSLNYTRVAVIRYAFRCNSNIYCCN